MKYKAILCTALVAAMMTSGDEIHTVIKRDNLWNLSGQYLSNPFLWPDIWNANPQIKNPHLIYPGEKITVPAHLADSKGAGSNTSSGDNQSKNTITQSDLTSALNAYYLNRSDLYSQKALLAAPYLETSSTEESSIGSINDKSRQMYTLSNTATIKLKSGNTLSVGDQVDIMSIQKGANKTKIVVPAGSAEVTSIANGSARIIVTSAWEVIRNNDFIVPSRTIEKLKTPIADLTVSEIESEIISVVHQSAVIKPFQTIIINTGKIKDVVIGDLFIATAKNELGEKEVEPSFRGIIIRSDAESSTLLVEEVRSYNTKASYSLKRAARLTFQ